MNHLFQSILESLHALNRSKKLIQQLHQLGISISYERVLQLEDSIASSVCQCFKADGVVSSNSLRKGLFTVGAIDNLDHNPSSTTSVNSFLATGISLFQTPTNIKFGESRQLPTSQLSNSQNHVLPDSYSSVPAVALKTNDIEISEGKVAIDVQKYDTRSTKLCLDESVTKEHT